MFILGLIFGSLFGALSISMFWEDEKDANELLKDTINNLEDDIDLANSKIQNRDKLIKDLQEERTILLNNSAELRSKITDLENNIELLTNNIPELNKELVDNLDTEN